MACIDATSLDAIRIEAVGEDRAVTASGSQWLEYREEVKRLSRELLASRSAEQDAFTLGAFRQRDGCATSLDVAAAEYLPEKAAIFHAFNRAAALVRVTPLVTEEP